MNSHFKGSIKTKTSHLAQSLGRSRDTALHLICCSYSLVTGTEMEFVHPIPIQEMEDMEEMEVFEACAFGNKLALQRIFEKNPSLLARRFGRSSDTFLHLVCRLKEEELASFFIRLQPDLAKVTNDKEETPLHEASRVGELEIVKELLKACTSAAYMLNRDKESALFIACSCGHLAVAFELCSRIDFLAWDEIGASCLRIAASKGYTEIVRKIIGENPSLAIRKDEKGFSALHLASSKGNLGVMNEFLEKDPNLSFLRDNNGRTPLHLAMIYNQVHVVKESLLETTRFNSLLVTDLINTADNNGDTILHLAAKINCLEIIQLLLSTPGMKANAADNEGNTALDILEQIPGDNETNVANDSFCRRITISQQLKARKRANAASLTDMQMKLIAVVGLIVTVTFQAVLSRPESLWQDLGQGNHPNHIPGKATQRETNPGLYTVFVAFNALGFFLSLALILFITILPKKKKLYVNSLVILALISIEVTFILSLIMIFEWTWRLYPLAEAELGRDWEGPWPI